MSHQYIINLSFAEWKIRIKNKLKSFNDLGKFKANERHLYCFKRPWQILKQTTVTCIVLNVIGKL